MSGVRERSGANHAADVVVLAVEPGTAERIAPGHLGSLTCDLLSAEVACLDVALSHLPNRDHAVVQDVQEPRFMSTQSCFAKVAPDGAALITSFKQLDPTATDSGESRAELEALLDAAQPGWRDLVLDQQYLPRITAVGWVATGQERGILRSAQPASCPPCGDCSSPETGSETPAFLPTRASRAPAKQPSSIAADMKDEHVTGTPTLRP